MGVFTYHNDQARDGANTKEYALILQREERDFSGKRFGVRYRCGAYAQPLWVATWPLVSGHTNIVIAATQHDTCTLSTPDTSPQKLLVERATGSGPEPWVTDSDVRNTGDLVPESESWGTPGN